MRKAVLKITYSQRKGVGDGDVLTIFCRVRCGRKVDYRFSTGMKVDPAFFDEVSGRLKIPKKLQNMLDDPEKGVYARGLLDVSIDEKLIDLETYISDVRRVCEMDGVEFNTKKLKVLLFNKLKGGNTKLKLTYFREYIEVFIESVSRNESTRLISVRGYEKKLAPSTIRRYNHSFNKFKEYEEGRDKNLKPIDINRHFREDFMRWLNGKGYTNYNTLYEHIKNIRRFAKMAEYDGYEVSKDIHSRDVFPKMVQVTKIEGQEVKETYLTNEEQRQLLDMDLASESMLENGRDLFIILCQTGLRVGDLTDKVISQLNEKTVTVPVKKTNKSVTIPVLPLVKEIIDKRTPHAIGTSALNKFVKRVCKRAGFTEEIPGYKFDGNAKTKRKVLGEYPRYELISSHTGRRSFATNALRDGVPAALICRVTGHSTETMLYSYLKVTPAESAEQFSAFYEGRSEK